VRESERMKRPLSRTLFLSLCPRLSISFSPSLSHTLPGPSGSSPGAERIWLCKLQTGVEPLASKCEAFQANIEKAKLWVLPLRKSQLGDRVARPPPGKAGHASRSRANKAHIMQSRPDSGRGFQVKAITAFKFAPSSLGGGRVTCLMAGVSEFQNNYFAKI
jgi:hypothetical protein